MKKIYILSAIINLFLITGNRAQGYVYTPRAVQLVHNSADPSVSNLKIWINDTVWVNNLAFQQATAKKTFAVGNYTVGISLPTATAQSQSIVQQTFELGPSNSSTLNIDSQFLIINGSTVDALHPLVISTPPENPHGDPGPAAAFITFHNGCTAYNALNMVFTPTLSGNTYSTLANLAYTQASMQNISFFPLVNIGNNYTITVNSGTTFIGNFLLPLGNYLQTEVNIVMNSSYNTVQKTTATGFGLAVVPASGGTITPMTKIETVNGLSESAVDIFHLSVFPNPVADRLTIALDDASNSEIDIRVTDVAGSSVMALNGLQSTQNTVDVSHLSQGIYFLTLTQGQMSKTIRFIKN